MTLIQGTQTRPAAPAAQLSGSRELAGAFDSVLRDVAAESDTRIATGNPAQGPSAGVRGLPRQEQNPDPQHPLTAGEAIVGLVPVSADAAASGPTEVLALPPALTNTGIADPEPADQGQPDAVGTDPASTDPASTAPVITNPEIAQIPLEAGSVPVSGSTVPVGVPTLPAHSPAPAPPPARGDAAKTAPAASSVAPQAGPVSASEPGGLAGTAPSTAQLSEEPASSGTDASMGQHGEKPTAATPVSGSAAGRPADGSPASAPTVQRVSAPVSSSAVDPVVDPARTVAAPPTAAPALTNAAPTPVAVPSTAPAAQAQPLSTQLAQPLFSLVGAKPGEHLMTIQVTPDNLGPVTVRAVISGDDIRIEMFAPSDSGREALRQILTDLRRDLAGGGLSASLDLSSRERFDEGAEHRPVETPSRRPAPAPAAPAEHEQRPAASGSLASTLDITI